MTEIQVLRQQLKHDIVSAIFVVLFYDRDTGIETLTTVLLTFALLVVLFYDRDTGIETYSIIAFLELSAMFYSMTEIQVLRRIRSLRTSRLANRFYSMTEIQVLRHFLYAI